LPGPLRPFLRNLHEIPGQVEEFLPAREDIQESFRHQRRPSIGAFVDVLLEDCERFAVPGGVAQHDRVGALFGEEAGQHLASFRGDDDGLKALFDDLRWQQDRLDQVDVCRLLPKLGQVRPEAGFSLARGVAACAEQVGAVEHDGAAARVALFPGRLGQHCKLLLEELLMERRTWLGATGDGVHSTGGKGRQAQKQRTQHKPRVCFHGFPLDGESQISWRRVHVSHAASCTSALFEYSTHPTQFVSMATPPLSK
jgi:hypothetical protein